MSSEASLAARRLRKARYQAHRRATDPTYKAAQNALCLIRARKETIANRAFLLEYKKSHPCVDCGEKDHRVLQFDHIDRSTKLRNVGSFIRHKKTMLRELAKCEVRCANCHAIKTWNENHQ